MNSMRLDLSLKDGSALLADQPCQRRNLHQGGGEDDTLITDLVSANVQVPKGLNSWSFYFQALTVAT